MPYGQAISKAEYDKLSQGTLCNDGYRDFDGGMLPICASHGGIKGQAPAGNMPVTMCVAAPCPNTENAPTQPPSLPPKNTNPVTMAFVCAENPAACQQSPLPTQTQRMCPCPVQSMKGYSNGLSTGDAPFSVF
jgi:hypothetical protein